MKANMQAAMSLLQSMAHDTKQTDVVRKFALLCNNRLARIVRWKGFMDGSKFEIILNTIRSFPEHESEQKQFRSTLWVKLISGKNLEQIIRGFDGFHPELVPEGVRSMLPCDEIGEVIGYENDLFNTLQRLDQPLAYEMSSYVESAIAYQLWRDQMSRDRQHDVGFPDEGFPEAPPHEQHPAL